MGSVFTGLSRGLDRAAISQRSPSALDTKVFKGSEGVMPVFEVMS